MHSRTYCPNGCQELAGLGECANCGYVGPGVSEDEQVRVIDANEETGRYEFQAVSPRRQQLGRWGNTGPVYITQGAAAATGGREILGYLMRHVAGDWGVIDAEDWETNNDALQHGGRLLSAYAIDPAKPCEGHGENCIWIITEADRSSTTILLPGEY